MRPEPNAFTDIDDTVPRAHDRGRAPGGRLARALDGMSWGHETGPMRTLDTTWRARSTDPAVGRMLDDLFAACAEPRAIGCVDCVYSLVWAPEHAYTVYAGTTRVVRTSLPSVALSVLLWHLNQAAIASVTNRLVIHAGAVSDGTGVIVMPAPRGAGKSTLAAALIRDGYRYVTDEAVALDPIDGTVTPYAKPLSIHAGSFAALASLDPRHGPLHDDHLVDQWHIPPGSIRADSAESRSLPVRAVIMPRFRAGEPTRLVPVSRAAGVRSLAGHAFNLGLGGSEWLRALASHSRAWCCYTLEFSDLDEACATIDAAVGERTDDTMTEA